MSINVNDVYTAGLIDGEGTITLTRTGKNQNRAPCVTVSSTTYELVLFLKEAYGGHIVKLATSANKKHKQAYHWQTSYRAAMNVITLVLPFMKEPEKCRRGQLILDQYNIVTPRSGRYTDNLLEMKRAFEVEFFKGSAVVEMGASQPRP